VVHDFADIFRLNVGSRCPISIAQTVKFFSSQLGRQEDEVRFYNVGMSGGFLPSFVKDNVTYETSGCTCWIFAFCPGTAELKAFRVDAEEERFGAGGIIVQPPEEFRDSRASKEQLTCVLAKYLSSKHAVLVDAGC
jgi:hypothetical protein